MGDAPIHSNVAGAPKRIMRALVLVVALCGLAACGAGRFEEADTEFAAALTLSGGADGPSTFFQNLAGKAIVNPPTAWDGVVVIESK